MGMTFEELGSILRAEREKLGLSIDDVANRLKISARVLRAVEAADSASLPHCVYVRGFVMSYARLLELDTTEFMSVEELYDPSEDPSSQDTNYVVARNPIGKGTIIFVLFVCLCLAAGSVVWFYRDADLFSKIKTDHLTTAQPAPSASTPSPEAPKAQDEVQPKAGSQIKEPEPTTQEVENTKVDNKATETEQINPQETSQETTSQTNTQAEQQTEPTASTTIIESEVNTPQSEQVSTIEASTTNTDVPLDGPNRVIITAVAECWVHSIADDSDTRQFSLRSGDTFALTFSDTLTLKLGNAGGVRIRYNGQETPIPGRDGEVKTITFPAE